MPRDKSELIKPFRERASERTFVSCLFFALFSLSHSLSRKFFFFRPNTAPPFCLLFFVPLFLRGAVIVSLSLSLSLSLEAFTAARVHAHSSLSVADELIKRERERERESRKSTKGASGPGPARALVFGLVYIFGVSSTHCIGICIYLRV